MRWLLVPENDYGPDIDSVGVPNEEGESWQEVVERRRETFDCALCGEPHDSRGAATRCCSERLD